MNENITSDVIEQFEEIRKLGVCNMYDFSCVQNHADRLEFYALASLERKEYVYVITNFSTLMKKFNINQE